GALPGALLRFSSRLALRLAGLRVHNRLRIGSPDRRNAPPPGKVRCRMLCCGFLPDGAALTRLRVHNRLRSGSPDRRNAPPPGKVRCLMPCCGFLPGLRCA
ncbi:hypothetical protein, partial [Klebsiella michiganensis]|uniref:hypothetical protein n=2 Tax=Klebsiella michiganensis TaxID=1134687 RepID=UPI00292D88C2